MEAPRRGDAARAVRGLMYATVLLFLVSTGIAVYAYQTNKNRIAEIQRNRISSCETTYRAFNIVFKPFFPPKDKATPLQLKQQRRFKARVDALVRHCAEQTQPPAPK